MGKQTAKQALEYLFMQVELMITYRLNSHKVYNHTEQYLPPEVNAHPSQTEEIWPFFNYPPGVQ